MTALHWATERHHRDVVELLIKYGADVHAFSKFDKSAFDIALEKNNAEILVILQVWFFSYSPEYTSIEVKDFFVGVESKLNFPYLIKIAFLICLNLVTQCHYIYSIYIT